jgi:hypothetical protein
MIPTSGNDWKSIGNASSTPGQKIVELFRRLPAVSDLKNRIWPEDTGKIQKYSDPEYCFHEIAGISGNQPFPCRTG